MDVPAAPRVPGYTLETLVRFSRSGETWLARSAGGEPVTVTLVGGALASAAQGLRTFRHPGAVPVTDVVAAGRSVALVSPPPAPVTLAALCAGAPALDPGEVVGIGLPVAWALSAAHDRGIVHGDLDPVDIVVSAGGESAVTGLGVAALAGAGVAPADDVHALALILRALLGDDTGPRAGAVRAALAPALSGHPAARPEAGELAATLSLACPPQPLRQLAVAAPVVPPPVHRLGLRQRLIPHGTAVTAALAVAGLLLLLLAAPLFGRRARPAAADGPPAPVTRAAAPTPPPAASPPAQPRAASAPATPPGTEALPALTPTPTQWQHTLQRLADARDRAFGTLDATSLAAADAPGSSAAAIDGSRLAALRASGVHAAGLASDVLAVRVLDSGAEAVSLHFEESSGAYDLVAPGGVVVEHRSARARETWTATLVRTGAGWRTATVTATG